MLADSKSRCIATSSGNTGAALAAYCAAAKIECYIAIVETAPDAKLSQMMAYGAHIFKIRGFGIDPLISEEAFRRLRQFGEMDSSALQVSSYTHSPRGMNGVTSISYELNDQLSDAQHIFCPAGGGGLCVAVAQGYANLNQRQSVNDPPAVHCVQPAGNDTIATPFRRGEPKSREVECTTQISGLQVPNVIDGDLVIQHCRPSGGTGHTVSDESIWHAQDMLAREEGIFCEPAAATALAGALSAVESRIIDPDATIVCLVTGTGFKDQASIQRLTSKRTCPSITLDELPSVIRS